jgi:hypothetical protein
MPSVVLQQVSNKFARDNASKTLDKPIALKYVEKHLSPEEFQKIESKCPDGRVYIWGAKAERVHQFGKMPHGKSLVLFRRNTEVYKCGVLIQWVYNPGLAEHLWGLDSDNETWGMIFFLKDTKELSVSASEINKLIERKTSDNWQALTAVISPMAEKVIEFVRSKLNDR